MRKELILVMATMIFYIVAYNFYESLPYFKTFGIERKPFYYLGAMAIVTTALALFVALKKHPIVFLFLLWSLNNLADELIFDPIRYQWSEFGFALTSIIYVVRYAIKKRHEKNDVS